MQDVGHVVEQPADAMAAEVAHDRTTLRLDIALDGMADVAGGVAGLCRRDAAQQGFVGDLDKPLGGALGLADRIHAAGIAVPAVEDVGHVDIDDVAVLERLVVGNAVADDMVDRCAGRLRVAAIVQRRGDRVVLHAEVEDEIVDFLGRDAWPDTLGKRVEAAGGELSGPVHSGEVVRSVEPDLAGVLQWCRRGVDIGDHRYPAICPDPACAACAPMAGAAAGKSPAPGGGAARRNRSCPVWYSLNWTGRAVQSAFAAGLPPTCGAGACPEGRFPLAQC